jgi:putative SOS response-associated peptidase YedK
MCGRFTLTADINALQMAFPWIEIPQGMQPRYNISPSQPVAVVPNDGKHKLDFFNWGLIPSWAKDPAIGNRMINARSETLAEKPSFRSAFKRRRCLVLADGFYEWKVNPSGKSKAPFYIKLKDNRAFAFAGLWEIWQAKDGSEIRSCTIITTEPNEMLAPIHNRMPVILPPERYPDWLLPEETKPDQLSPYLKPYSSAEMVAFAVSNLINNPKNDLPACVQAL